MQKPVDEKIIQEFMTEIQQHREEFREQIEAEYQKVQQVKVTHPFLQQHSCESETDLRVKKKFTKISPLSRPQTGRNSAMLDEILEQEHIQGRQRDEEYKNKNTLVFYGTSRLSTMRNFQITGVKQIVKSSRS